VNLLARKTASAGDAHDLPSIGGLYEDERRRFVSVAFAAATARPAMIVEARSRSRSRMASQGLSMRRAASIAEVAR